MKAETHYPGSDQTLIRLCERLKEVCPDIKLQVTISNKASKSTRQRGLQWKWYGEVANAGVGGEHEESANGVHLKSKWKWAVPLLRETSEEFTEFWENVLQNHRTNPVMMKFIVRDIVSTEGKDFPISRYLTSFERYYRSHGVNLTIPESELMK